MKNGKKRTREPWRLYLKSPIKIPAQVQNVKRNVGQALQNPYEFSKHSLLQHFHTCKINVNDSVAHYIAEVQNIAGQLQDVGENISEVAIIAKICGGLSVKFAAFLSAWDSVPLNKQTIENVFH